MALTTLAYLAQVIMDPAIAINTTAFQPGMLDETEQLYAEICPENRRAEYQEQGK